MHYNIMPLKLYRANRVMDFGDTFPPTRIGEVMLLPVSQRTRDLEMLGAIEAAEDTGTEEAQKLKKFDRYSPLPLLSPEQLARHGGPGMTMREIMEAEEEQQYRRKARSLFRRVVAAFRKKRR